MRIVARLVFFVLLSVSLAPAVLAQSWGPLSLEELKKETQRRSDRNLPPLSGIKPDDTREAMAMLIRPAPIVFGINGLDSHKEDVAANTDAFLKQGVGVFAIDMPGTGQAPLLIDVGAERIFSRTARDFRSCRAACSTSPRRPCCS